MLPSSSSSFRRMHAENFVKSVCTKILMNLYNSSLPPNPQKKKKSRGMRQDYDISDKQSAFENGGVRQVARVKLKRFDEFRRYLRGGVARF